MQQRYLRQVRGPGGVQRLVVIGMKKKGLFLLTRGSLVVVPILYAAVFGTHAVRTSGVAPQTVTPASAKEQRRQATALVPREQARTVATRQNGRATFGQFYGYTYYWHTQKQRWVVAAGATILGRQKKECSKPPGGDHSHANGYYELDVAHCDLPGYVALEADYLREYGARAEVYHPGLTRVRYVFFLLPY